MDKSELEPDNNRLREDEFTKPDSYWEGYDDAKAALSQDKEIRDFDRKSGVTFTGGNDKRKSKSNSNSNSKEDSDRKKERYVQKHSDATILLESVIVGQRPYFAISERTDNSVRVKLDNSYEDEVYKYLPLEDSMSIPYTFKTEEDFYKHIEQAKKENLDSLYKKTKYIWEKYIDANNLHISICAADTIFTYFQDKIGMTHYLFFVGGNDTGKSNNLRIFQNAGYRCFCSMGITYANIYTFLGNGEEGQGIICEDEADSIDYEREKLRIYKSGYTKGMGLARTDLPHGERKQNKWNTFCFKAFAAERLPDSVRAKGFNQRIIELKCSVGQPSDDISEILDTGGDEQFQYLLDELNATHNLLLAYKLVHFHDKIPNIKLNISNREKQLFKPILRLFQNTNTFNDLLPVVSELISRRRERNINSLESVLYDTVMNLVKRQNSLELLSSLIWNEFKSSLPGQEIPNKSLSYESEVFGTISQKQITSILEDQFGAKRPKRKGSGNRLIFDKDRLTRLRRKYAIKIDIKVAIGDVINENGEDGEDGEDIGLDGHLSDDKQYQEITITEPNNEEKLDKTYEENQDTGLQYGVKPPMHHLQTSPTSPTSPNPNMKEPELADSPYKDFIEKGYLESNNTEIFICKLHRELFWINLLGAEHHCMYGHKIKDKS